MSTAASVEESKPHRPPVLDDQLLEALPAAAYVCDLEGVVVRYNKRAAELWGRSPIPGDANELYCGAHKLYLPNGDLMPHNQTPMVEAMRSGASFSNLDVQMEQPSGKRIWVMVSIDPLRDATGAVVGAINCFQHITEQRRKAEDLARVSEKRLQGQKDAFQAAISGEPLSVALNRLSQIVIDEADGEARTSYFLADAEGKTLNMLRGAGNMPDAYGDDMDGFLIGKNALACGLAIASCAPVLTRDVREDPLWEPWLNAAEKYDFRSCWSFPIADRSGKALGTFTMYFREPRSATPQDIALADVVTQTAAIIISRDTHARERVLAENKLRESEDRFRMLADNMNQLAWTCDHLGDVTWYNQRWLDYTGFSFDEMKDWGWKQVQHPDHVDRVVASVTRSRNSGQPWEDIFPLLGKDGEYRWFLSRAVPIRDADGRIVRWFGTNTDVTAQRQADETQRMLNNELSHRVKNMLATVQAIATQTSRHTKEPSAFVEKFGGRIQSMSRIHAMLGTTEWQGAELREVIRDQLVLGAVDAGRITASGPNVQLTPQLAPNVALMLHELGTNSIKYGALSTPNGIVTINWSVEAEMLRLQWTERGGPAVKAPARRGFGSRLIEQSATSLGGSAWMSIEAEGARWDIAVPLPREGSVGGNRAYESALNQAPLAAQMESKEEPARLQGRRFLIVEDEPLVGLDIAANIEEAGGEVTGPAGSTDQALSLIDRMAFDAALLDGNLHGSPVHDIAAALTRKNVPFAFVTGYGRQGLPSAFAEAPILSKPFSREQLLEVAVGLVRKPVAVIRLRGK